MTDLIGGQVNIFTADFAVTVPQHKAGKIRGLAVTSTKRASAVPELPTVDPATGARDLGVPLVQTVAITNEGQMLLTLGKHREALASLQEASELSRQLDSADHNVQPLICEIHHVLALIYKALDRLDDAWREARAALRMAQDIRHPQQIGLAQRAAGELVRHRDDDAVHVVRQAHAGHPGEIGRAHV